MSTKTGNFIDQLNDAIRENPVSAGLIGIGVAWMFIGSAKVAGYSSEVAQKPRQAADLIGRAAATVGGAVAEAAERIGEAAHRVNGQDKKTANKGIEAATTSGAQNNSDASQFGTQIRESVERNITTALE